MSTSTAVNTVAIAKFWDLKRHVWFWMVILLITTFNVSLAIFVHWPRIAMTRLTLLPIGVAYYCLTVGVVRLVEKIVIKSPAQDGEGGMSAHPGTSHKVQARWKLIDRMSHGIQAIQISVFKTQYKVLSIKAN